jgi:hypothetical protein
MEKELSCSWLLWHPTNGMLSAVMLALRKMRSEPASFLVANAADKTFGVRAAFCHDIGIDPWL